LKFYFVICRIICEHGNGEISLTSLGIQHCGEDVVLDEKYIEIKYRYIKRQLSFGAVLEKGSFCSILLRIPFLGPFCDLFEMLKDTKK
jgi:hypothetical protein